MLFPLWPFKLKYYMWLVSLTIFVALIVILLLRTVLYVVLSTFGVSFWIFPNLMGNCGLVDSFRPLYSTEKWEKDRYSNIMRIIAGLVLAYYLHSMYVEPDFYMGMCGIM
jgi:hypothetical protein